MEAIRPLTSEEQQKIDTKDFAIKITVEVGPAVLKGSTSLSIEELLKIIRDEISQHPNSPYAQYLDFVCTNYESFGVKSDSVSPSFTNNFGPCGSCYTATGVGRWWYNGIGRFCSFC